MLLRPLGQLSTEQSKVHYPRIITNFPHLSNASWKGDAAHDAVRVLGRRPSDSSSTESADYGSFCHFAVLTRNYGDGFTGHFAVFAVLTRNYGGGFTGHFSISLF